MHALDLYTQKFDLSMQQVGEVGVIRLFLLLQTSTLLPLMFQLGVEFL